MGKLGGHKQTAKRSQTNLIFLAFGYLAVSVGFIAVIVGLMNWRLEATKETTVKGGNLVAKDGKVAKIQAAESFGQLYDLPSFDMQTLNQLKHVTVKLITGDEESFVIQRFQKRAGVKMLTLFDASGNTVSINAVTKSTVVKVDGKMTVADGTSFNAAKRRSLANSEPVLHSREEFFALRHRQGRGLSAGSGHLGYAQFLLAAGEQLLDEATEISGDVTGSLMASGSTLNTLNSGGSPKQSTWQLYMDRSTATTKDEDFTESNSYGATWEMHITSPTTEYWAKNGGKLSVRQNGKLWCGFTDNVTMMQVLNHAARLSMPAFEYQLATTAGLSSTEYSANLFENVEYNTHQSTIVWPTELECYRASRAQDGDREYATDTQGRRLSNTWGDASSNECHAAHMASDAYTAGSTNNGDLASKGWKRDGSCETSNGLGAGSTYVQFYKNDNDERAIVYRGSDDLSDFFQDVANAAMNAAWNKIFPIGEWLNYESVTGDGGETEDVHSGIYKLFNSVKTCVDTYKNGKTIKFVAGHSLGGALAEIHGFVNGNTIYTFGALRTMNNKVNKDQCAAAGGVDGIRHMSIGDPAVGDLELAGISNLNSYTHVTRNSVEMYADHIGCTKFEQILVSGFKKAKKWVENIVCSWFNFSCGFSWRHGFRCKTRKECEGGYVDTQIATKTWQDTDQCAFWSPWSNHNKKAPHATSCNAGGHNSDIASNSWSCHSMDHYKNGVCR
jgi:hypothetical protein